jgi:hypothetical protein
MSLWAAFTRRFESAKADSYRSQSTRSEGQTLHSPPGVLAICNSSKAEFECLNSRRFPMRASIFAIASCLCLSAPAVALAQSQQPAPQMQKVSDDTDSQRMICRYSYYQGSVIRHRVCHTKNQWNDMRFQSQRELTDFQTRSLTSNGR